MERLAICIRKAVLPRIHSGLRADPWRGWRFVLCARVVWSSFRTIAIPPKVGRVAARKATALEQCVTVSVYSHSMCVLAVKFRQKTGSDTLPPVLLFDKNEQYAVPLRNHAKRVSVR